MEERKVKGGEKEKRSSQSQPHTTDRVARGLNQRTGLQAKKKSKRVQDSVLMLIRNRKREMRRKRNKKSKAVEEEKDAEVQSTRSREIKQKYSLLRQ